MIQVLKRMVHLLLRKIGFDVISSGNLDNILNER